MSKPNILSTSDHAHEHQHAHSHECHHEEHSDCDHHHHDHDHDHHHGHHHHHGAEDENHWFNAALGMAWGIGMLVLAVGSFNLPMLAYYGITASTSLVTWYLGRNVYKTAWNALWAKELDMSILYSISTLTILAVSLASLFIPGLPMMFEAAPLVLGFWHLGEGIEHALIDEIGKGLDIRDGIKPSVILKGIIDKEIHIEELIPGNIIEIHKGEVIPVDGELIDGAELYTTSIDGSPHSKRFEAGAEIKSGMRVPDHLAVLKMRVSKTYNDSYLSQVVKNANQASKEKAPVELFANKVLQYFIPGLLAVAVLSGVGIGLFFGPALAIQCVISVLVSACPCALSLITPMAVRIGMKKASEHGIQFQGGKALQVVTDIDAVVFDLNGTLTQGIIEVSKAKIDRRYLAHVALLEGRSKHQVAKAVTNYVSKQFFVMEQSLSLDSFDESNHSGIQGIINGERFIIGNQKMLSANGIKHINKPYDNPENGSVYVVRGTAVIGQIAITDPFRPDALKTVLHLRNLGKEVHICTGADMNSAKKYAAQLGIPEQNICANTVGTATRSNEVSKSSYIQRLKSKGLKVAMVGDAINDVEAFAHADVGVAIQSAIGSATIVKYASIVVQKGLLFPIATAFDIGKKTKDNIYQNLFVSLAYNSTITLAAAGLFVGLGFTLNPALGVMFMIFESTVVLANLYRFKKQEVTVAAAVNEKAIAKHAHVPDAPRALQSLGPRKNSQLVDQDKPRNARIQSALARVISDESEPNPAPQSCFRLM